MSDTFETYRPLMFAIAYRMMGSAMEAEDIVQDAYLRYQAAPAESIRALKPFLTTVVTRLCLDQLKSARSQREEYIGHWLPEPLVTAPDGDLSALNDSLSMAFLVLLEQLNPVERAVFLLREVFDYEYSEVAAMVGKSEPACRQAFHRARQHINAQRPRFDSTPEEHSTIFGQFLQACAQGDMNGLVALLAADVTAWSDGGGKVSAALHPLLGRDKVAAFMLGLFKRRPQDVSIEFAEINGRAGLIVREGQAVAVVITADVAGGQITALRLIRNPDKLRRL
jgi:RNA polymerase sigma-70 factor (ECF subfamily)